MKKKIPRGLALAAWASAGLLAGCAQTRDGRPRPPLSYESGIGPMRWSDWANLSLNAMVEKYGPPTRIESKRVVWEKTGPWKRISVWDNMNFHQTVGAAFNIEETLAYLVPEPQRQSLEYFDGRVFVSEDGSELSSRSFDESYNFLALNLADQIIRGVKTPEEANDFYADTIRLEAAGKASVYMQKLLFTPPPVPKMEY